MANIKSSLITNSETSPQVRNNANKEYGKSRTFIGSFTTGNTNAATPHVLCKLNPNWVVTSIKIKTDGNWTSANAVDLGLYTGPDSQTLTAADVDCYATDVDFSTAIALTELAFEARTGANADKMVYEDAGDTAGQFNDYWLALTPNDDDAAIAGGFIVTVSCE